MVSLSTCIYALLGCLLSIKDTDYYPILSLNLAIRSDA